MSKDKEQIQVLDTEIVSEKTDDEKAVDAIRAIGAEVGELVYIAAKYLF